jgi:adenylosuccinate synthase
MSDYPDGTIIVGLQDGDESKGKVAAALCSLPQVTHCVRYSGGQNAGHVFYKDGIKVVTHIIPSGIVYGKVSVIGPGCVFSEKGFWAELEDICDALGETISDLSRLIKISPAAHIVQDKHIALDEATDKIGSTKRGIAPVYADKAMRTGIRAESIPSLKPFLWDTTQLNDPKNVIAFEGAQGFGLDPDAGHYPYVTSSSSLPGAINSVGVPIWAINKIVGVAKLYATYVGTKKFEPDLEVFEKLRELGEEYGSTTGRPRQCNWLNLDTLITAIRTCGCTTVVFSKCDIIEQLGVFKLIDGGTVREFGNMAGMIAHIKRELKEEAPSASLIFSGSPYTVEDDYGHLAEEPMGEI